MSLSARFFAWIFRFLRRSWLSLLLLGGIYTVTAGSLGQARWVPNSDPILAALALGMIVGAALASTRWRAWLALVYTLLLAPLLTCQAVGQIVPPLDVTFSQPFLALVDLMNVRLFAFFARLGGWLALYQGGQSIQDTGLFVILACLLVWLTGAWLTWCALRWQAVLWGMLPLAIVMAVNVNLSGQDVTYMVIYLGLGLLLLAQAAHRRQHRDWEKRSLDYPEDLGLEWSVSAASIVLIVALAARLAPVFGTAEGWRALSDLFRPAQQQVEDTAARIFSQVSPPRVSPEPAVIVDTPALGVVGAPPATGNDVVFWVSTSDPAPPPPEAGPAAQYSGPQHYWRSQIYTTYTGRGWEEAPFTSAAYVPPSLVPTYDPTTHTSSIPAPPGRYVLQQTFQMEARHNAPLFSASQPVQVDSKIYPGETGAPLVLRAVLPDGSTLVQATPDALAARGNHIVSYTVTSFATKVSADQLAAAGTNYSIDIRRTYLQLPDSLPQRVRDLGARLAQNAATPYDIAIRIQNYLRLTYTYTLDVPPPPAGRDVTDYFLFEAPGGFCSYYATAMAVLLRTQGVPARVVTGYATGSYDYSRNAYAVTAGLAHAWVEVYFPGFDWVEFEPTVSQVPFGYASLTQAVPGSTPAPEGQPFSLPPVLTFLILLLVLAGGVGVLVLLLRFLGRGPRPGPRVDLALLAQSHYFTVRRALGQAGVSAASSATPNEFLAQATVRLERCRGLSSALQQATQIYEEAAFSPRPPAARQVESARQAWGRSFWEWLQMVGGNLVGKRALTTEAQSTQRGHREKHKPRKTQNTRTKK
jgi:transglutaminase-like putative cysteine protease